MTDQIGPRSSPAHGAGQGAGAPAGDDSAAAAIGAVREGAIALDNLAEVLRSPRVAARSLARALPTLQEGPQALGAALGQIEQRAAERLGESLGAQAFTGVFSTARRQLDDLAAELAAVRGALGARARLGLEARTRRAKQAIAPALALAELTARVAAPLRERVEVSKLLAERWRLADGAPPRPRHAATEGPVTVSVEADGAGVFADAQLLAPLIELAVHVAARGGEAHVRYQVGPPALRIAAGVRQDGGERRVVPACPLPAPAADLARAVATLAGYSLRIEPTEGASTAPAPRAEALAREVVIELPSA